MKEEKEKNYFERLYEINTNDKVEKKNNLKYLSWAWAWAEVKKIHPDANYTIYENKEDWNYFTDGRTGWVKTGVLVNGIEHIEYLPIMDYKNKSLPLEAITSFDVNKTIQRSLTKAVARHGLGLYIYAGEDLPELNEDEQKEALKLLAELEELCFDNNIDRAKIWEAYKVSSDMEMTTEQLKSAIKQIKDKLEKKGK